MVILIAFQIAFPLLPFYAMGYMLGTCVLHIFVVEDRKDEYRRELQAGMNAHLSKPVDPEHLYLTLEELIGERDSE